MNLFKECTLNILDCYKKHEQSRPFIIGVDGLSGSGKTTLSKQFYNLLSQNYTLSIIHLDDHINCRSMRYNTRYKEWYEYYYLQWDVEMLTKQLFNNINNNVNVNLPFYNKVEDNHFYHEIQVAQKDFCIIEGVFLQRDQWKHFFDYIIYIDCPRDVRFKRVIERDLVLGDQLEVMSKYDRRYWPGEEYYLSVECPKEQSDFILFNT
ncbi:kinase [Alkalibacillus haloalkaliphilus]|uniref:kinase n=1 Tax=Alkalibacillus haloalkaliphilus TaxID=94136 RepID=UPI0029360A1A|nr:kinase [Alkalibacillus haloalkaliphilus]MDV2582301.1 kinase [Alkalibacillus haloalkaliphilus]